MGYRMKERPKNPDRFLPHFFVINGSSLKLPFACYYFTPKKGHDPHFHDHIGWPQPNHPDDSCQMLPPRYPIKGFPRPILRTKDDLTPIDLAEEGYFNAKTYLDIDIQGPDSVMVHTEFSETESNVVDVTFVSGFDGMMSEPIDIKFTVFVEGEDSHEAPIRNVVCHGILTVLPGPFSINSGPIS